MSVERPPLTLTAEEMQAMHIPPNFWRVARERITAQLKQTKRPLLEAFDHYLQHFEEACEQGAGLLLSGPNDVGKTAAAVWLAKEFRRRHKSVLFMPAASLIGYKIQGDEVPWKPGMTYWQWAQRASVLVLDDFGKGGDAAGHVQLMWDDLLRERRFQRRITILTTNLVMTRAESTTGESLEQYVKPSTLSILIESVIPLYLIGEGHRRAIGQAHLKLVGP